MKASKKYDLHPLCFLFPELPISEYEKLKGSIATQGLDCPVLLTSEGAIVDGRHRYKACQELGVEVKVEKLPPMTEEALLYLVWRRNLTRRHLDESQRAMVAAKMRPWLEKAAKERQKEGSSEGGAIIHLRKHGGRGGGLSANLRKKKDDELLEKSGQKSAQEAADKLNVGSRSVEYAVKVLKSADSELIHAVESQMIPVSAASRLCTKEAKVRRAVLKSISEGTAKNVAVALKQQSLAEQVKAIKLAPPIVGKFEVLVVDPAWKFDKNREDDASQRGQTPYPPMTEEEICAIKLPATENCILWLWTTNAHLVSGEALRVLQAWGFQPKAMLTWGKTRFGTGDWLRGQTEHCILATHGRPVICPPLPSTLLIADTGAHSEKPDAFYALVEKMCPGTKGELFARKVREGWNQHGVELGSIPKNPVVIPAGVAPVPEVPAMPAGTMPPVARNTGFAGKGMV